MQEFPVRPALQATYQLIERCPGSTAAVDAMVQRVIDHLIEGSSSGVSFHQTPRMGRACFAVPDSGNSDDSPLVGFKGGVGASWASELIRAHLNNRNQKIAAARGYAGGCLRLPSQPPYLVIYERYDDRRSYELTSYIPEGISSFPHVMHDFVISRKVYEDLDISAARSRAILRGVADTPWKNIDETVAMKDWLVAAFREQLVSEGEDPSGYDIDVTDLSNVPNVQVFDDGSNLDIGVLVREFHSPLSLEDIDSDATRGRWSDVHAQLAMLGEYGKDRQWSDELLAELAKTAGIMLDNGVLHRQISGHYQDISAVGELRDFDVALVSPFTRPDFAAEVRDAFQGYDPRVRRRYESETQRLMSSEEIAACRLVGMAYAFYSTALRFKDVSRRAHNWDSRPGTVLTADEVADIRARFVHIMSEHFTSRGPRVLELANRVMNQNDPTDHHIGCLFEGFPTPLGWTQPERPFGYESHNCTRDDLAFIVEDCGRFSVEALGKSATAARRPSQQPPRWLKAVGSRPNNRMTRS